jgi:RNA polymerase sigma-70 factor, ECF subfamily
MEHSLDRTLSGKETGTPAMQAQETVWILSCQRGDTVSFNRLVLKWEKKIYNLALRMLHDREEAAEAAQEVFWLAYRNIQRFRLDSKFSTWLFRIAVNHCISRLRQRPPGAHFSMDDPGDASPLKGWVPSQESHEKEFLLDEQKDRVRRALTNLPDDQKAVLELKFFQELTFEEIAEVVQAPLSTIKSRLYAGLESLKSRLGRGLQADGRR